MNQYRVFNEKGLCLPGGDLELVEFVVEKEVRALFEKMFENGLDVIQVRAASEHIASTVSLIASEVILGFNYGQKLN